ncbi:MULTISPECIES: hypothetical protein [unclassified Bacillus (in: firmicutes)]|uniref:DUF6944 family repetitive protein n=1 Tax=unclassified Bacillus (in: firmicutes) TaxID=185979 RepID=UPI000B85FDFC|nr:MULTISPECIES: hypothetical protein [unclassified Bacillus (in: firmicutes)]
MDDQNKEFVGSWIQAIGTVTAAVGATPFKRLSEDFRENLSLWGNLLQGTGNALVADSISEPTLDKRGNQIQSIGNTTVVASIIIDFDSKTKQELEIKGNLMQALGGGASLGEELQNLSETGLTYDIVGNYLQVIGNSMQAIGGRKQLNKSEKLSYREVKFDGDSLQINGSWIQAVGSVIAALGVTKEIFNPEKNSEDE